MDKQEHPLSIGLVFSHSLVALYLESVVVAHDIGRIRLINTSELNDPAAVSSDCCSVIIIDLQDLELPVSTYVEAFSTVEAFSKSQLNCPLIALDRFREPPDVARLLMMGFAGYLSHDEVARNLGAAICSARRGETWATPEAVRLYIQLTSRRRRNGVEVLTDREEQILDLVRKRYSNREMADFMAISQSTVKFHVSNVMSKLNVHRRRDLFSVSKLASPVKTSRVGAQQSGAKQLGGPAGNWASQ